MDNTAQIKNSLISKIKDCKDLKFLKTLQTIFELSEQELYQLSSDQKNAISVGRKQIKDGQFSNNQTVMSEMKECQAKK